MRFYIVKETAGGALSFDVWENRDQLIQFANQLAMDIVCRKNVFKGDYELVFNFLYINYYKAVVIKSQKEIVWLMQEALDNSDWPKLFVYTCISQLMQVEK